MQTQTSQTPAEAEYARCALEAAESRMDVRGLNLWYGDFQALKGIDLSIPKNRCTAFIGPSGCGKSTLLRTFNRMCDFVPSVRHEGRVELDGTDVFDMDACALRIHVGMVFQHPNPFPMSIRDNVLYGPSRMGKLSRDEADEILERCLTRAALWEEAKDKLDQSGLGLSGGQQQR
ncbi:phosphate ABC transporter ATP-binding protein, partial [Paratractidigestivibacter faecalis]|uniref:phosphate ABC transporter ATP-binding protein n=1 Tax=Paratractidigestivibacter faecalis TaxID=2292441 RepID=UPI003AF9AFA2